jgi:hypothetical protein
MAEALKGESGQWNIVAMHDQDEEAPTTLFEKGVERRGEIKIDCRE